jgi:hypothetical protein
VAVEEKVDLDEGRKEEINALDEKVASNNL